MNPEYLERGYFVLKSLFSPDELGSLHSVLQDFHSAWLRDNTEAYQNGVLNSAYLTGPRYLGTEQRMLLFQFIARRRLMDVLATVIPDNPAFMNTQLFFNPSNPQQRNYWHRDVQYTGLSVAEQKVVLSSSNVVHFRIPLTPELGLELVPGSHRAWDSAEEFAVRTEHHGRKCFEDLASGQAVALQPGDLLVFSANMIHRGLYGLDRFALDILFCDMDPDLLKYAEPDCLPDAADLHTLENSVAFANTRKLIAANP